MKTYTWTFLLVGTLLLFSGCGAITGLPGHGGGKRFSVEQELVAAATRGAIKQIDLSQIKGKKVNLFVNAIGDTGTGNLIGGRLSVVSTFRGDYTQLPTTTERYPTQDTRESEERGAGGLVQTGTEFKGLGAFTNSTELTSNDLQYLSGLLQTYLYLKGVNVVPPSEAEVDVYVTVDVFGTIRTRVDWLVTNNEILRAKTSLEVLAIDHLSGKTLMMPQTASAETEYNEKFVLWVGPVSIIKSLKKAEPLLSDFSNLDEEELNGSSTAPNVEQNEPVSSPFH